MRKVFATVTALALVATMAACTSNSKSESSDTNSILNKVLDRGHLIVGTGTDNPPWHFKDDNGDLVGMDVDMGHILAEALFGDPDKVEYVTQSADSRIPNILTGKVDISFQFATITPARAQKIAFSVPYYTEGIGLILPANGPYADYDALQAAQKNGKKITIAILQNVDAEATGQELLKGAKIDQYESQGLVYQAVESGRADAAAVDASSIDYLAAQSPDKWKNSGLEAHQQNYGALMNPTDQVWINFVNTVLIDSMTGATYPLYDAAYKKWFGKDLKPPLIGKPQMFETGH